jgi:Ni/Co efflux regulator RcnB
MMRTRKLSLVALAVCAAWPALAYSQRDDRREEERRPPAREEERRPPPREAVRRAPPPHFAQFRRGQRLAEQYRHRNYVVADWRLHHLHEPPRGYQWVSVGPDYLLVAIATGVIAEVLANGQAQPAAAVPPAAPPPPAGAANAWYFCASANAYYPYVAQCPEGWQVVPATPPQ